MVKHIVFFKLLSSSASDNKQIQLKKLNEIFSPLGNKIPYITEFRTAINFNTSDQAWDFVIDSVFNSRDDLDKYQVSEEHQEAIRLGRDVPKSKAVIDYEF